MNTKKLTTLAMLSAIAFVLAAFARVPIVLFLRYDPKDVVIAIGGFIFGPMAAFMITVVVSVVQMFTVSQTGFWGLIMNIIASSAFCCPAAYIYKKNRTLKGAVYGLIAGFFTATIAMMLWNYLVAPIYMGVPRAQVAELLLPAFLPFNLIKNGLNVAFTILLYKHVKSALGLANLLPPTTEQDSSVKFNFGIIAIMIFVVITCVLWVLVLQDIF
ncbi:MAG: ECF transporter S component [Defluviitaleaceae bacterium]|nr:ECF transporter S component [Defluviitaleaceae bacterium]